MGKGWNYVAMVTVGGTIFMWILFEVDAFYRVEWIMKRVFTIAPSLLEDFTTEVWTVSKGDYEPDYHEVIGIDFGIFFPVGT